MTRQFAVAEWTILLVGALALTACDEKYPLDPPTPVASIEIIGPLIEVVTGTEIQFSATPRAADGSALNDRTVSWSSTDTTLATVSATGLVVTRAVGVVMIRAVAEGKTGSFALSILPAVPTVARVVINPGANVLAVGATRQYHVRAYDTNDQIIDGPNVTWSSRDTTRAKISATGLVTAVAPGYTDILATVGGRTAAVGLTVEAPAPQVPVYSVVVAPGERPIWVGEDLQLNAFTFARSGGELHGRAVIWSSASPGVAQVSPDGKVTAIAAGTARIRAVSEGKVGYATVHVLAFPTGPVHEYRFDGTQEWRVPFLDLGPTTWTDPNGVVRNAYRVLTGGSLRLIFGDDAMPRWEQQLTIATYLSGQLPEAPVATQTLNNAGVLWWDFTSGTYILKNGALELRTRALYAGELLVYQPLFGGTERALVWKLAQGE